MATSSSNMAEQGVSEHVIGFCIVPSRMKILNHWLDQATSSHGMCHFIFIFLFFCGSVISFLKAPLWKMKMLTCFRGVFGVFLFWPYWFGLTNYRL